METREWLDSLGAVLEFDGRSGATFLPDELIGEARRNGAAVPYSANTPYLNGILITSAYLTTQRNTRLWVAIFLIDAKPTAAPIGGYLRVPGMTSDHAE